MGGAGDGLNMKVLWTDSPFAMQRVSGLHQAGEIDDQQREDLTHFIDHGWLVWRGAIGAGLIDAFAADIRDHHRYPGKFVTTDHRNSNHNLRLSGNRPDRYESLFDLYVNLPSARAVCFHPRISSFLSLVLGTKPVANQQLLFQRSNGHRVHQDTSVVALEDPICCWWQPGLRWRTCGRAAANSLSTTEVIDCRIIYSRTDRNG